MTLDRLRIHATLMAAALWTVLAIDYSVPGPIDRFGKAKGTDFLQYYVAGSFAREGHPEQLYNFDAQHQRSRAVMPTASDTIYVPIQSPLLAFAFAPLTRLSYAGAFAVWALVIAALYAWSCRAMWTACAGLHAYRREALACCLACPAFYSTVLHGQTSVVSLALVCAALVAIQRERQLLAGIALGCLVFKPHWALLAAAVFVCAREWRIVAGIGTGALAEIAMNYAVGGAAAMRGYLRMLRAAAGAADLLEPRAGHSLRSFFDVLVPWPPLASALFVLGALAMLAIAARVWRSDARFEVRASTVVMAILLISPHAFEYDLILLVPVFFLMANLALTSIEIPRRPLHWALLALFVAPLLTALPAPVRVQFSVTAMAVVMWLTLGRRNVRLQPDLAMSA